MVRGIVFLDSDFTYLGQLIDEESDDFAIKPTRTNSLKKAASSKKPSRSKSISSQGSEGIDKIFFPQKLSLNGSVCSQGLSPLSNLINESPRKTMEKTLTLLEEAVADSQAKINALISDIGTTESFTVVKQPSQKIESMQGLVVQLPNQL
ncbi:hypothetical protein E2542_SST09592 [Spatholobus suberectus]|nr:hypothetical protein E2542_SST09592 [Spatholobus suberectus]